MITSAGEDPRSARAGIFNRAPRGKKFFTFEGDLIKSRSFVFPDR